jgi:predicted dehydrogenase
MSRRRTRREFLQASAMAGAGFWVAGRRALAQTTAPSEKLGVAVIGVTGQGHWNLGQVSDGEASAICNIVALCDVDEKRAGEARAKFPKARFYTDFRTMLDAQKKDIDAVVVATPDHTHAAAALPALRMGKHVYCEKPLAHTVHEVRLMREAAAKAKVTTQMGTQIHSHNNYRRVVELIQTGAVGEVREVHVWVEREWGGLDRPKDTPPVPEGLHYDLWIGPAPYRPYNPAYLPASWRGWWDFGGGTLADMACHYMDLPFWALNLRYPLTVEAEGPAVNPESCPIWLIVKYQFPARDKLPPVNLTWYNGKRRPHYFADGKLPQWGDGVLFVGAKGMLLADYDKHVLLPEKDFADFKRPEPFIPDSIGHHLEWLEACKSGEKTTCNFDYSGALAETVLLGNVAYRSGSKLEWDAKTLKARNAPKAAEFIDLPRRRGWEL